MMGWVSRYRHGRGFGVHSPFAYRLITEVLRETLPYYDWDRVTSRRHRLLYRLLCRFRPNAVSAPPSLEAIVKMASPSAALVSPGEADFLVIDSNDNQDIAAAILRCGGILLIFSRSHKLLLQSLLPVLESRGHGMVFDNERDTALIVPSPRLPFQVFNVRF